MKLAALFSDHAVLQRGRSVPVWGWTTPRTRVYVKLGDYAAQTLSGADGQFVARLPPMPAGGPFVLEVHTSDPNERVTVTDVLVGEVWICSGQSNMEWLLKLSADSAREIAQADAPGLRMITIPRLALAGRQTDVNAAWQVCRPDTAGDFSAVGYHFARFLQNTLKVPVGMVNTSWGGTRIETWISREALVEDPELQLEVERTEATVNTPEYWAEIAARDLTDPVQQEEYLRRGYTSDPGNTGLAKGWAAPDCADQAWPTMALPTQWQAAGHNFSGVFWFRRSVEVPAAWAGKDLLLGIGAVDKTDITYFNGVQVGATGQDLDQSFWAVPRVYRVPGKLVQAGRNVIAVRACSFIFHGGLIGPADKMALTLATDDSARIPLPGDWRFTIEHNYGLVTPPMLPFGPGNHQSPGILYDNMIAPLVPYGLRGAIWYQGESNADNAARYGGLLAWLIRDWRHAWGQGDFAFLTVQLANFQAPKSYESTSTWAVVREKQLQTLELSETGLAVTIDIGDALNIHPLNKRDVGQRLAQWALTRIHGLPGVPSGPLFAGATIENTGIRVRFHHGGGGLVAQGGPLRTFVIAGPDRKFVPAEAVIDGPTVVVSHPQITWPMAVRYAWADNPAGANLYNVEGYPASPFRTDAW